MLSGGSPVLTAARRQSAQSVDSVFKPSFIDSGGRGSGLDERFYGRRDGLRLGRMKEESLNQVGPQLLHRLVLLGELYSLGDHLRALIVRETHHRLHEVLLDEILVDAVDEGDVELDEVRLQVCDRAKAGIAASRVVDGEAVAAVAEVLEASPKLRVVLDGGALGDLQNHARRIRHVHVDLGECGVGEVVRIDVDEQQLAFRQSRLHSPDGGISAKPAQLPDHVRLRGHLEHDLGPPHASHRAASKRLVAEDLLGVGDDDRVVIDIQGAGAKRLPQVRAFSRELPLLYTVGRSSSLANAAVDLPFEPDLRVVVNVGTADIRVEESGNGFPVCLLDSCGDELMQTDGEVSYLLVGWNRNIGRWNVKQYKVIVVGEADHHLRCRERALAEKIPHRLDRRLQDLVELLPSVDLLDLCIPIEVEVEDDELAALLYSLTKRIESCRHRRNLVLP